MLAGANLKLLIVTPLEAPPDAGCEVVPLWAPEVVAVCAAGVLAVVALPPPPPPPPQATRNAVATVASIGKVRIRGFTCKSLPAGEEVRRDSTVRSGRAGAQPSRRSWRPSAPS